MAINKELYERYKAMKAAKLAAAEQNNATSESTYSNTNSPSGFKALSSAQSSSSTQTYSAPQPQTTNNTQSTNMYSSLSQSQGLQQSSSIESYSTSKPTYQPDEEVKASYGSQFVGMSETVPSVNTYSSPTPAPTQYTGNVQAATSENVMPAVLKFALIGCPLGHSLSEYTEAG